MSSFLRTLLWGRGVNTADEHAAPASQPEAGSSSSVSTTSGAEDDDKYSSSQPLPSTSSSSSTLSSVNPGNIVHRSQVNLSRLQFESNGARSLHPFGDGSSACDFVLFSSQEFETELRIYTQNQLRLSCSINSALIAYFVPAEHAFVWLQPLPVRRHAIRAQFLNAADENAFHSAFSRAAFEAARQEKYDKTVKDGDEQWIRDAFNDDAMDIDDKPSTSSSSSSSAADDNFAFSDYQPKLEREFQTDKDDEEDDDEESAKASSSSRSTMVTRRQTTKAAVDDEEDEDDDGDGKTSTGQGRKSAPAALTRQSVRKSDGKRVAISHLSVGLCQNRTYASRGSKLGVFKHDERGSLQFITQTSVVDQKGKSVTPHKLLLKEGDNKLAMLNSNDPTRVYEMDIERGVVVQEYGGGDGWHIRNVGGMTKYEEESSNPMILGVNANSVFSLDPRINGANKIAQKQIYAVPTKNSCLTATTEGYVAVGSDKGEIRMFDAIEKRAKTMLPGLGDPIIGMDVTADGEYLLATTKHYLLLIHTASEDGSISGFKKSISAKSKAPVKLQLSVSDLLKFEIAECNFSPAKFDVKLDTEEWIVTSTGPYIVKWNFKKLKQGKKEYNIKKSVTDVVDAAFVPGQRNQVVVALPEMVYLENLKKAANPVKTL